ncbi:hypothetical protein D0469_15915 [Peribacillus saganii]|uniref:Uncharacterized protein n=1 Tax=Peribacillus saganii TaxID=2303992 RepID=A0A372LKD7_9BACI|nr:hypothetical protein [Peribacillus saganii]RFU67107.1 hypothetical protein D0469_15915 [Peribacillus saganii]
MGSTYATETRFIIVHEAVPANSGTTFMPTTFFDALQQVKPQCAKKNNVEHYRTYPMKDISTISIDHSGNDNMRIKFESEKDKIMISEERTEYGHNNPAKLVRALEYIMIKHHGTLSFFTSAPAGTSVKAKAKRPLQKSGL